MKKILVLVICFSMAWSLSACLKKAADPSQVITASKGSTEGLGNGSSDASYYVFVEDIAVKPGEKFNTELATLASSVYEALDCALGGYNNVYNFKDCEITARSDDGSEERVLSVYFKTTNIKTNENIGLGDSKDDLLLAYGDAKLESENELIFAKGSTEFVVIVENDAVISLECRSAS